MPHNSNQQTTELTWPGKSTEVDRVVLPFQTVETVNKPRVEQEMLFAGEWPEDHPVTHHCALVCGEQTVPLPHPTTPFAYEDRVQQNH